MSGEREREPSEQEIERLAGVMDAAWDRACSEDLSDLDVCRHVVREVWRAVKVARESER